MSNRTQNSSPKIDCDSLPTQFILTVFDQQLPTTNSVNITINIHRITNRNWEHFSNQPSACSTGIFHYVAFNQPRKIHSHWERLNNNESVLPPLIPINPAIALNRLFYQIFAPLLNNCVIGSAFCSTFELNNIILIYGGASPQVSLVCGNNKSTRYAGFFNCSNTRFGCTSQHPRLTF